MKPLYLAKNASVSIVYRGNTPKAVTLIKQLVQAFSGQVQFSIAPEQKGIENLKVLSQKQFQKSDMILAIGGDGTYLRANQLLKGASVPILGIHLGALGFLTPIRHEQALDTFKVCLDGQLVLLARTQILVTLKRAKKEILKQYSINDVIIERGASSHLIDLKISGLHNLKNSHISNTQRSSDTQLITYSKGDGIIISTPMGSTAYNLAAGGPILHPDSQVFALTPIAPHSLTLRPLVLPDTSQLKIAVHSLNKLSSKGRLVIDGQIVCPIKASDELFIKKATQTHWLIRDPHVDDYTILREKLKFGERI